MARQSDLVEHLGEVPLFSHCSKRDLQTVARSLEVLDMQQGARIVGQGDAGNAFYVILDGQVRVDPPKGASVTLKAGDSFGEMALLDGAPRSADITADGEVTVMVIGRAAFQKLLRSEPQMVTVLLRTLASRLRAAQEQF